MTSRLSLIKYIKNYNLKELSNLYEVETRTMKMWLKRHEAAIGEKDGQRYTPKQVEIIFEKLGLPKKIIDGEDEA
jgi:transposase